MSMLLRDVIDIPEKAGAEDYVLRLTDSVEADHVDRTIADYVVTPALSEAFDAGLDLVSNALRERTSRGAFLAGSFGSGKSHYMAMLYALLRHNPLARAKEGLQPVVERHDDVLRQKRILPLTFHFLGATSMEQRLFDGYIDQVRALHPGSPLPALHQSDRLLADAEGFRSSVGDEAFFARLNASQGGDADDAWSSFLGATEWTRQRYDAARAAVAGDAARQELVTALTDTFFSSYTRQADYVDIDSGLAAISAHAKTLGYDAVVLFLDEVVLWLAFGVRDSDFFRRESQKLTKLVESGSGHRPIPLVSFVARQMDLRQWFADSGASGAQQEALDQAFKHQEGRFARIVLGDDNLAYVASQRLLRPKDDAARRELDEAFASLDRRTGVWDVLLDGVNTDEKHRGADEQTFRRTYPFSPALVSTLRSLAGVMQRERTALKVMQQMLVDRRDTLTIDDVVPVGDAFDLIVQGQTGQALDPQAAALFRSATRLYAEKIRPQILRTYSLTARDVEGGLPVPAGLVADERLAKTLLLSAVAPNVPALKGLTAQRLASLNHGSITSMVPNNEAVMVLGKVRDWAKHVPEIRVDRDSRDPVIAVQLADIDYESIIERARGEDNEGRRRELTKDLVARVLGITLGQTDMLGAHTIRTVWRGSSRDVDVVVGNVRDAGWLTDDHFTARPGTWRFVIDFPFDEPGHSSAEDLERIDRLLAANHASTTIVWLPRFFSEERMRDLRRLVLLNWLLDGTGERYSTYSDHLSETDRLQAKAILSANREALRLSLEQAIEVAYGAATPMNTQDVVVDAAYETVMTSLDRAFSPQPPLGGSLASAFQSVVKQAYDASFPGHPEFAPGDQEVRKVELGAVNQFVVKTLADPEHRVHLDGPHIVAIRRIANSLGVGQATETHFLMGDTHFGHWNMAFERALGARADADAPVSVAEARGWIDAIQPAAGLKDEVADLVILAWAALKRRAWFIRGAAIPAPSPGELRPEMEMRLQEMPTDDEWRAATALAGHVYGVSAGAFMTPAEVAGFADRVKTAVLDSQEHAHGLVRAVEEANRRVGLTGDTARLVTARTVVGLADRLRSLGGVTLIRALAAAEVAEPGVAGRSLKTAPDVGTAVARFPWERLDPIRAGASGEGASAAAAARILTTLREAIAANESTTSIAAALSDAEKSAYQWVVDQTLIDPPPPPGPGPGPTRSSKGQGRIRRGESSAAVTEELQRFLDAHRNEDVIVEWRTGG